MSDGPAKAERNGPAKAERDLLKKTSNLRDELLEAAAKLAQYADALQHEALRLKKLVEDREESP